VPGPPGGAERRAPSIQSLDFAAGDSACPALLSQCVALRKARLHGPGTARRAVLDSDKISLSRHSRGGSSTEAGRRGVNRNDAGVTTLVPDPHRSC
jgi:hypothetical protein